MSRRDRLKQGQEAKDRVLSGMYNRPQQSAEGASPSRRDRLKSDVEIGLKGGTPGLAAEPPTGYLVSKISVPQARQTPQTQQTPTSTPQQKELPGRDIPVIGSILRGIDKVADVTLPFAQGAAAMQGVPLAPTESVENRPVQGRLNKILYGAGALAGGSMNPAALEQSLVTQPYRAAQGLVSRYAPNVSNTGQRFITGMGAGAGTGAAYSLISGQSDTDQVIHNAAIGGLLGAAGDVAIGAVGDRIGRLINRNALARQADNSATNVPSTNSEGFQPTHIIKQQSHGGGTPVKVTYSDDGNIVNYISENGNISGSMPASSIRNKLDPIGTAVPDTSTPSTPVQPYTAPTPTVQAAQRNVPREERSFYSNVEATDLAPEVRQGIAQSEGRKYTPITNEATLGSANARINKGLDESVSYARRGNLDAEKVATAQRAVQELQRAGRFQEAVDLVDDIAAKLTKAGQTIQAASMMQRLTPEGQLMLLTRRVREINKSRPADSQLVVTPETAAKLTDAATAAQSARLSQERSGEVLQITSKLLSGETLNDAERQTLSAFADDLKSFIGPEPNVNENTVANVPSIKNQRTRDKVVSALNQKAEEARKRLAAKRNTLSANPLDQWADMGIIAAAKIADGAVKFGDFSAQMIQEFGDAIRPQLGRLFEAGQRMIGREAQSVPRPQSAKQAARDAERAAKLEATNDMVQVTKETIRKVQEGTATAEDIENMHVVARELTDILGDPKVPSEDKQLMQLAKQLARKLEDAEYEKSDPSTSVREIQSLIRRVTKISSEDIPAPVREKIDNESINKLAYELFDRAVPGNAEKVAMRFVRDNKQLTDSEIDNIREIARMVSKLSGKERIDHEIELQKILNAYEQSSPWDKVQAIRYISMLLNTGTQAINALSGPAMATTGYIADLFGAMADSVISPILKQPRTLTAYKAAPFKFLANWFRGAKVGGKAGWQGVNPSGIAGPNDIRGLTYKGGTKLSFIPSVLERSLGAIAKGADYGTYTAIQQSELRRLARLDARNKGVTGAANINRHIEDFVANPSEESLDIADKIARSTTFQRQDTLGGKAANFINSAPGPVKPVAGAIFPFVRTPVNIASTAVTLTPAGIIKGLYQMTSKSEASQREALRTLGLGITGTGILTPIGYELSRLGIITGANDSGDKDVDAIREQAGQGKYRFNTSALSRFIGALFNGEGYEAAEKVAKYREGDHQFDYNKLQPLAFPMAIGAGLQRNAGKLIDRLKNAGTDAFGSLYGMSTLKGVQDVFQPSYGGTVGEKALGVPSRIVESFLKSFSPSLLAQEARRQDPIQRKTSYNDDIVKDVQDYFQSRTPGLSQQLPPNKTTLGQDRRNSPGIVGQYANPYKSDVAPYTEAAAFIADLIDRTGDETLAPSAPDKKVRGKDRLTGDQVIKPIPAKRYAQLQEEVGNEIIKKIMKIDGNLTDAQKAAKVKKIYDDVNEKHRNIIKREFGIRVSR